MREYILHRSWKNEYTLLCFIDSVNDWDLKLYFSCVGLDLELFNEVINQIYYQQMFQLAWFIAEYYF